MKRALPVTSIFLKSVWLAVFVRSALIVTFLALLAGLQAAPEPRPNILLILADGTELLAPYATLEGGAKFFGKGWDNDWAVFPTSTAAVVWNLEVPQAGNDEITVLHTATEPGGRIEAIVGEQTVETTLAAAHNPPEIPRRDLVPRWEVPDKAFAPLKLGTLAVPAGTQQIKVKAAPGIEIQSVRLDRIKKDNQ